VTAYQWSFGAPTNWGLDSAVVSYWGLRNHVVVDRNIKGWGE